MTECKAGFKCRDCKDECLCPIERPVDLNNNVCFMFFPKKEVRLPIEEKLIEKIAWAESGELITLSLKEIVILRKMLYKDMFKGCVIGD